MLRVTACTAFVLLSACASAPRPAALGDQTCRSAPRRAAAVEVREGLLADFGAQLTIGAGLGERDGVCAVTLYFARDEELARFLAAWAQRRGGAFELSAQQVAGVPVVAVSMEHRAPFAEAVR